MTMYFIAGGVALGVFALGFLIALVLRRVVPTNEVHIVQRGRSRVSYGASQSAGRLLRVAGLPAQDRRSGDQIPGLHI